MSDSPLIEIRPDLVEGVVIIDLLPRELTEPDEAARLGEGLRSVPAMMNSKRLLINTSATKYMSSTAFAVLISFGLRIDEAGGRVALCGMDPFVRVGADIVKLGRIIPIYDDEPTALAALIV